jgi:branched-subunit amino acid ABC-type transport system permease component
VLNFAHGALFMIGAFVAQALLGGAPTGLLRYAAAVMAAGLVVAALSGLTEVTVFRPLYKRDHIATLLAGFALFLLLGGAVVQVWGNRLRTQSLPDELAGSVTIAGATIASYDLALIGVGLVIALGLWALLERTVLGRQLRAASEDRTMAMALGVRAGSVGTGVFVIGGFLAGIAGGLAAPLVAIDPGLGAVFLLQAFVVIIVGGIGSVPGALVASLTLGIVEVALTAYVPTLRGFSFYLAVALVLLLRPQGILGRPMTAGLAR